MIMPVLTRKRHSEVVERRFRAARGEGKGRLESALWNASGLDSCTFVRPDTWLVTISVEVTS